MNTTTTHAKRWSVALLATTAALSLSLGGCTTSVAAASSFIPATAELDAPLVLETEPTAAPAEEPVLSPDFVPVTPLAPETAPAPDPLERSAVPLVPTAASTDDPDPRNPLKLVFDLPDTNNFGWYNDAITARVRVTSTISSNAIVEWSTSGAQVGSGESAGSASIPITAQGVTVLTVSAVDDEGNTLEPVTRTIRIDSTAPVVRLLSPDADAYRLGETLTADFDCTDVQSGTNTCTFYFAGTTYARGAQLPLDQLGTFAVRVLSLNEAGLTTAVDKTIRVLEDEHDAPTVEVDAPPAVNGWWNGLIYVTFRADDAGGSGVKHIEYRKADDSSPDRWTIVGGDTAALRTAGEGENAFQVRATDWFGNVSELHTFSFPTDMTAPTVTVNLPAGGVTVEQGEELVLEYDCDDAGSLLAVCEADVASGATLAANAAIADGEHLDTDQLGTFQIVVRAVDNAGNETLVERSYTVAEADLAGPVIAFDAPEPSASGWFLSEPNIPVTVGDASELELVEWGVYDADGELVDSGTGSGEFTVPGSAFPEGESTLRVRALDVNGNETIAEFDVKLDTYGPLVTVVSPTELDEVEQGADVPFVFTCTDAVSGVVSCESTMGARLVTDTLGEQLVVITAVDGAGQTTTVELAYTVVPAADPAPGGGTTGGATGGGALASTGAEGLWITLIVALSLLVVGGAAAGSVTVARSRR